MWLDHSSTIAGIVAKAPDEMLLTKRQSDTPVRDKDTAVQGIRDLLDLPQDVAIPKGLISFV